MILGTKTSTGKARCMFTDKLIPAGDQVVEVRISTVQVRQASYEGLMAAFQALTDAMSTPPGVPPVVAEECTK